MVLEILTLIEICAAEVLVYVIYLVRLRYLLLLMTALVTLLHLVHQHAFLFVNSADPL